MSSFEAGVKAQVKSFYAQRSKISHRDQVKHVITDDVFSKRLELAQTDVDKAKTIEGKAFLQEVNGTVVWGKTNNDTMTVIIASKVFQFDLYTWKGTVHHEYTHAHDYWDLADYLGITEMDAIYDYEFYYPFKWWSEYHARKAGASNVYRFLYPKAPFSEVIRICNQSFADICKRLKTANSIDEAVQEFGRYSALKGIYGNKMPNLQTAIEKYGVLQSLVSVGDFLHSHQEFALIQDELEQFQKLVDTVSEQKNGL